MFFYCKQIHFQILPAKSRVLAYITRFWQTRLISLILLFALAPGSVHAGNYIIDGTNTTSSNLFIYYSGWPITANASGFSLSNTPTAPGATDEGVLTIRGLAVRYEQKWHHINIWAVSSGGDYDLRILNKTGVVVYQALAQTGSILVDLSINNKIEPGESLQLEFTIRGSGITVKEIRIYYERNTVFCFPSPYQAGVGTMGISFDLPADAKVTIQILDNGGREVKRLLFESLQSARQSRLDKVVSWDGRDNTGRLVATGIYVARVRVRFVDKSAGEVDYEDTFRFLVLR